MYCTSLLSALGDLTNSGSCFLSHVSPSPSCPVVEEGCPLFAKSASPLSMTTGKAGRFGSLHLSFISFHNAGSRTTRLLLGSSAASTLPADPPSSTLGRRACCGSTCLFWWCCPSGGSLQLTHSKFFFVTLLKLGFFPFLSPKQSLYRLRTCYANIWGTQCLFIDTN